MYYEEIFITIISKILSFKIIECGETAEKLAIIFSDVHRRITNLTIPFKKVSLFLQHQKHLVLINPI